MTVDALLSAFFTEILFKDRDKNKRKMITGEVMPEQKSSFWADMFFFWGVSFIFLLLNVGITLGLFALWIHFVPQGESLGALVKRIFEKYSEAFLVPLVTTVIAGIALKGMTWEKKWAKSLLCFVLALSALASSLTFLWNSVEVLQRPYYAPPVESISALVNSRLKVYPFILSVEFLEEIGDGEYLISSLDDSEEEAGTEELYEESFEEPYEEPDNFREYLIAIIDGTYAPGKGEDDYLLSAYHLYMEGRHGNDYFYIGVMWYYLYIDMYYLDEEFDFTKEECLENAIEAYQEFGKINEDAAMYSNMAMIYDILNDRDQVRACMRKAIELDAEDERYIRFYAAYIYAWIGNEQPALIMEDAKTILQNKNYLSMYILYGAYAIAENRDIVEAYEFLCKADEYYQGKSTMVQILRCICADMININDTIPLYDIYQAEKEKGLTEQEELYLIRYLFTSGRYDELWGYINEIGTGEGSSFSVDKAAMKASWYFSDHNEMHKDVEGMENLLHRIDDELETDAYSTDERNLLLMSRSLLKNRLIENTDIDMEEYETDETSDIEYVFSATNAFNNAEYDRAIRYCETFFNIAGTLDESGVRDGISLQDLAPQEQVTLRYYMQLISAHAHYECAKRYSKDSEEWQDHIDMAEKECDAFDRSAKSFFYIEEYFEKLRGFIYKEKGEWPTDEDEKLKMEET